MKELLRDVIIALVIALIVIQFVRPTIIKESSMEPNLYNNNYIFVAKMAYKNKLPEYGDIIVFKTELKRENGQNKNLIKRVIGLPGDTIKVSDNQVWRNGELLDEPYIKEQGVCPGEVEVTVPDGSVFAMGDNRAVSIDSRYEEVGCISIDDILGRAFYKLFPFGERTKL